MKYRRSILPRSSAPLRPLRLPDPCGIPVCPPLPTTAAEPVFSCRCGSPGIGRPCGRCILGHPSPPPHSTTAAEPVFSCRCGSPGTGRPMREVLPEAPRSSAPCHDGSETGIFLPLRKPRNWPFPARGASHGTPVLRSLPQRQRNPYFPAVVEIRGIHIVTIHFRYVAIC